ncbi:hypothetical protein [Novosphingopyxis sp. YJ-S2-01]|uniref:hypothetical protein n=1 Tax=Novosphingopyxis sp. YJ-S2-01 TaxID=2794021 RepID=UPI0018DD3ACC|nr:hypothetical protein [Novosphingopyxis sp. YJ-S2-01]MBH9538455.1 hypothetical protein [Novosphingopyxis sp. YJ-S2-01]
MTEADSIASNFWRDGFAVIRDAFDPSDVLNWRREALRQHGLSQSQPADLLSIPGLCDIVLHPRLLYYARDILGEKPLYFGDSTFVIGAQQGAGFHKDCTDRYDRDAPDWSIDRYPIIRFGIYAQAHGDLPGGIDFLEKSHNYPDRLEGPMVSPEIKPGDLVVWNGRTSHSANSPKLRVLNLRVRPDGLAWRVLRKARLGRIYRTHPQERVAFFVSIATDDLLTRRHVAYLNTRSYAIERMRKIDWTERAQASAAQVGLQLVNPHVEVKIPPSLDYRPVPYDLVL